MTHGLPRIETSSHRNGMEEVRDPLYDEDEYIIRYERCHFPKFAHDALLKMENFEVREDDTWVISFPKSGTTWVQEIVYLILHDANIEKAKSDNIENRFPYLEFFYPGIDEVDKLESPRFIKSHFPYHLLPRNIKQDKKAKIIYVTRNPRDTIVSLHHFLKAIKRIKYRGDFRDTFNIFLNDQVVYSPWLQHVLGYWDHRHDDDILFLKYEDMQMDLSSVIKQIAMFLGKSLTGTQIDTISEHCTFQSMSQNNCVNYTWTEGTTSEATISSSFMRKGKVGDWQNYFTPKMIFDLDEKVEPKLKNSGLVFDYTLKDYGKPYDSHDIMEAMSITKFEQAGTVTK